MYVPEKLIKNIDLNNIRYNIKIYLKAIRSAHIKSLNLQLEKVSTAAER